VSPLLFAAVCAGMVIVPVIFESYTFYLYTIGEPEFFVYSGARLWFFLASELGLGFALGLISKFPLHITMGFVAVASLVLALFLYQLCDTRQCYHSGPDGISWLRFGILLFATAATGALIGTKSKKEPPEESGIDAVLSGAITAVLLGYYPLALVFGTFMTYQLALVILAFASSVPFLLAGIVSATFSSRARYTIYSALIGWAALAVLFAGLRPDGAPLLAIVIAAGIPAAMLGVKIARHAQKHAGAAIIALFALVGTHPYVDAPMNLAIDHGGVIVQPTYYAGAYHDEPYFPTKRVEVEIDLDRFDGSAIMGQDFVLAGIGAQSPNCCKDGLDYGYRADVLFTENGRYLVARAWETCDHNVGCSAFSWTSMMHESIVPLPDSLPSVMLAMEWDGDDITANWYYKTDGNWSKYSSFVSPEIENPYYNLGVIWVGNPFSNHDGNAYFFQAGVSTSSPELQYGQIKFDCPSYYDLQDGKKHCPPLTAVERGNSHWKVLWKWGVPDNDARVEVQGTAVTIS
jgi:hypothetical protein